MINKLDLSKVILKQHVTEKASSLLSKNQYVFKIHPCADKPLVKKAIEEKYNVKIQAVNTVVVGGKIRRFGQRTGKRSDWKKAYVTLENGYSINSDTSTDTEKG